MGEEKCAVTCRDVITCHSHGDTVKERESRAKEQLAAGTYAHQAGANAPSPPLSFQMLSCCALTARRSSSVRTHRMTSGMESCGS